MAVEKIDEKPFWSTAVSILSTIIRLINFIIVQRFIKDQKHLNLIFIHSTICSPIFIRWYDYF